MFKGGLKCISSKGPAKWKAPPHVGVLKLNTDAYVTHGTGCAGLGGVIRDNGAISAELGEFLVVREGLINTLQHGFRIGLIERDVRNVPLEINKNDLLYIFVHIVDDVKPLISVISGDISKIGNV